MDKIQTLFFNAYKSKSKQNLEISKTVKNKISNTQLLKHKTKKKKY